MSLYKKQIMSFAAACILIAVLCACSVSVNVGQAHKAFSADNYPGTGDAAAEYCPDLSGKTPEFCYMPEDRLLYGLTEDGEHMLLLDRRLSFLKQNGDYLLYSLESGGTFLCDLKDKTTLQLTGGRVSASEFADVGLIYMEYTDESEDSRTVLKSLSFVSGKTAVLDDDFISGPIAAGANTIAWMDTDEKAETQTLIVRNLATGNDVFTYGTKTGFKELYINGNRLYARNGEWRVILTDASTIQWMAPDLPLEKDDRILGKAGDGLWVSNENVSGSRLVLVNEEKRTEYSDNTGRLDSMSSNNGKLLLLEMPEGTNEVSEMNPVQMDMHLLYADGKVSGSIRQSE